MPRAETNGIVTFYEDAGRGPLVVLIHGHSADHQMWKYQVDDLAEAGLRVLRYDVRGHGRSTAPPAGYTWDNYAKDLAELAARLDDPANAAHLVGCSMGGAIALAFALTYPERVRSMTLVDSALPGFTYSHEFSDAVQELVGAVREHGPRTAFERLWLSHPFFEGIRRFPERFEELREVILNYRAPEYRTDYPGEGDYVQPDVASRLQDIRAPALVVVGENDIEDFQIIAEILASAIPNARKAVIEDTWHLPSMEKPEVFNRILVEFIRAAGHR